MGMARAAARVLPWSILGICTLLECCASSVNASSASSQHHTTTGQQSTAKEAQTDHARVFEINNRPGGQGKTNRNRNQIAAKGTQGFRSLVRRRGSSRAGAGGESLVSRKQERERERERGGELAAGCRRAGGSAQRGDVAGPHTDSMPQKSNSGCGKANRL